MRLAWRIDQLVTKSLVVSFAMVVCDEVGERLSKVAFTERDHAIQAFLFDRADEPLRMSVAVWCPEVVGDQPVRRPDLGGEEIGRQEGAPMRTKKAVPRDWPLTAGRNAVLPRDLGDC
jgi:hypothetical protein